VRTDRQTYRLTEMTKLEVAFRNFVNAPKNWLTLQCRKKKEAILTSPYVTCMHVGADEPQSVNWTCGRLRHHSWEVTDGCTLSSERAPSDFYLFQPLQKRVAGKRFESDTEVKQAVASV